MAENIFGKKVYILNPSYQMKQEILAHLRDMEYETYIIENFRNAKNILRHNPESIVYINVDSQLTLYAWYCFILSLKKDPILSDVIVGILSNNTETGVQALFMNNEEVGELAGGIISTKTDNIAVAVAVADVLAMHNAKGRRQYVRANCLSDKTATVLWTVDNMLYQVKMVDISSVGSALMVPVKYQNILQEKSVIRNATFRLGIKQVTISFVVYAVHQKEGNLLVITLFLPETPTSTKAVIKDYVYETLQNQMLIQINGEPMDRTDYNAQAKLFQERLSAEQEARRAEEKDKGAKEKANA